MNRANAIRSSAHTALLACALTFASADAADAQVIHESATAALAGVVRDTAGRPIRMATVEAENAARTAVADDSGRFHINGIPSGRNDFTVRRIGYRAVAFAATLAPDSTLILTIRMTPVAELDPVTVAAEGSVRLHRAGFYERRTLGLGSFLGPEDIAPLASLPNASMMMLAGSVRGVRRVCQDAGTVCDIQFRSEPCRWLFVDNVQVEGAFDELVVPMEIAAVEVYDRASTVPSAFQGHLQPRAADGQALTSHVNCGAIAVWTRIRARLR